MELKRCLFGCLLALASVGTASAMGVSTQDPTAPHATIDSGSHAGGGAGSDSSSANHDCILPDAAGDSADDSSTGGGGGAMTPHPRASRRSSLGWQSLLPGSIQ
ncbi:hypothetical protein [Frateuria sp.]|uniref:hypothetical protein n=1 Tax=Frateuria sp. TaxID=2211372 RepID=UPI003F7F8794